MLAAYLAKARVVVRSRAGVASGAVAPVEKSHLLHAPPTPAALERAKPELPVLIARERGIEAADVLEQLAANESCGADVVAIQQPVWIVRRQLHDSIPCPEEAHEPICEAERWLGLKRTAQSRQRVLGEAIVGVENQRIRSLNILQARVSGRGDTRVCLAYELHPRGQSLQLRERTGIGRAVIDDDHPRLATLLAERALDTLAQEGAVVKAGDDHGDVVVHEPWAPPSARRIRPTWASQL